MFFKIGVLKNSQVVKAAQLVLTGPQIGTSFCMINDIIDIRSSRMDIPIYSAIMKMKFGLIANGKPSFKKFKPRKFFAFDMRTARSRYVKRFNEKRESIVKKKIVY